jgi:hypothetical protein
MDNLTATVTASPCSRARQVWRFISQGRGAYRYARRQGHTRAVSWLMAWVLAGYTMRIGGAA